MTLPLAPQKFQDSSSWPHSWVHDGSPQRHRWIHDGAYKIAWSLCPYGPLKAPTPKSLQGHSFYGEFLVQGIFVQVTTIFLIFAQVCTKCTKKHVSRHFSPVCSIFGSVFNSGQFPVNFRSISGQFPANFRYISGIFPVYFRPMSSKIKHFCFNFNEKPPKFALPLNFRSNFRLISGQFPVNFRSNFRLTFPANFCKICIVTIFSCKTNKMGRLPSKNVYFITKRQQFPESPEFPAYHCNVS